jgi:hypothetical protein
MKRVLLAALLICAPSFVWAQVPAGADIWRPKITGAHVVFYDSTARAMTSGFSTGVQAARVMCSSTCAFISRASGNTLPATTATGWGLAPLVPWDILVEPNGTISVIQAFGNGRMWIIELTR